MALSSQEFVSQLKVGLEARKAERDHPWIKKFGRRELIREEVRGWIEQRFYKGKVTLALRLAKINETYDHSTFRLMWTYLVSQLP